jgi:acyl-CoA thioester hydrolase
MVSNDRVNGFHRIGTPSRKFFLPDKNETKETTMETLPELSQFAVKTDDKLRYADTDRQGHINNAVFSTLFETGRVEIFYNPDKPLASENCAFVIVNITLNYLAEMTWPGKIEIGTRVSKVGRSSVNLEQALFQGEKCVATASTVIVQMNESTRRSQALDEQAAAYLTSLMSPVEAETV